MTRVNVDTFQREGVIFVMNAAAFLTKKHRRVPLPVFL